MQITRLINRIKINKLFIIAPKMINIQGQTFRIMRREVSEAQVLQFAKINNYDIKGHEHTVWEPDFKLPAIIKNPIKNLGNLVCLSLIDGRAYATWLSVRLNRKFRVPTEAEWLIAMKLAGRKLTGEWSGKNWEWTETRSKIYGSEDCFVLRAFGFEKPAYGSPEFRHHNFGIRLVEDI